MLFLYNNFVYNPLYNGLIFLMDLIPWKDAGIAVILFTIIVRLILFPLSKKAIVTQVRMKEIEPEIARLRESVKDRQAQALKMMELYKEKKISPFSSFLVLLIQLPILFALYSIFINGLPKINETLLYFRADFVPNMHFLNLVDISEKSLVLALIAAAAQYFQLHYSLASMKPVAGATPNPQMEMAHNMTRSMKYIFPIIVFVISYNFSAVIALYWAVSSLFTLGQELIVRKHLKEHKPL